MKPAHASTPRPANASPRPTLSLVLMGGGARTAYQAGVVAAGADDILVTDAVTGIPASFVRSRLRELGVLDERDLPAARPSVEVAGWGGGAWSAGQGAGGVADVCGVAERVERVRAQYAASRSGR